MRKKINEEKLKKLYAKGLSDRLIANELGVARTTVLMARKRLNLPANYRHRILTYGGE